MVSVRCIDSLRADGQFEGRLDLRQSDAMQYPPTIRKEPADRHTYGPDMARHGSVYCAYDGERLVCYAGTAGEARKLYRAVLQRVNGAKAALANTQRKR
jgi:hypothetical protein